METADILLSVLFGGIGFGYFMYGRRRQNIVARYCGIGMMLYPYLASSPWEMIAVGVGLMVVPRFIEL
ncbi:hypothetical protein [Marinobacter oulmenensis]|uniref:Amino acid transport protein n=1 Tax=Marinobacter oulmenensis TaxID=643747 RepID=A0A840U9X2_9GAMM|nr:hypothetical protein [Marinobacter oulmenensis]MBB5321919.1 hypothetical protein [Marinobacter oulmenensis]